MKPLLFTICLLGLWGRIAAQDRPRQDISLAMLQAAMDSMRVGGQVEISFKFTELEIKGDISSTSVLQARNAAARKKLEAKLAKKTKDAELLRQIISVTEDTAALSRYRHTYHQVLQEMLPNATAKGEIYYEMGKLLQSMYQFESAFEQYVKAQELMPDSAKVYQKIAELFFFTNQFTRAQEVFEEVLRREPAHFTALLYHTMSGMFATVSHLNQTPKEQLKSVSDNLVLDTRYIDEAIKQYPKRRELQHLRQYFKVLWVFYRGLMVGVTLSEATALDLKSPFKVSSIFYVSPKDIAVIAESQTYFKDIIDKKQTPNTALAYECLGIIHLLQDQEKQALEYLEKASQLNPEKGQIHYNIAFLHLMGREFGKAEAIIRRKMNYNKDATDYLWLASVTERQENTLQAKQLANEGLEKFPNDTKLMVMKGLLLARLKQYPEAEQILSPFAQSPANYQDAVYGLALAQMAQGKWAEGSANMRKVAEAGHEQAKIFVQKYH